MGLSWLDVLAIAIGGGLGGIARLLVSEWMTRRCGEQFPWGTLLVNATGAVLIGALAAVLVTSDAGTGEISVLWSGLVLGLLGSYTTVSSFSWQTLALAQAGRSGRAAANVVATVVLCLVLAAAGHGLARIALATADAAPPALSSDTGTGNRDQFGDLR